jgi:hypothetical protein
MALPVFVNGDPVGVSVSVTQMLDCAKRADCGESLPGGIREASGCCVTRSSVPLNGSSLCASSLVQLPWHDDHSPSVRNTIVNSIPDAPSARVATLSVTAKNGSVEPSGRVM